MENKRATDLKNGDQIQMASGRTWRILAIRITAAGIIAMVSCVGYDWAPTREMQLDSNATISVVA